MSYTIEREVTLVSMVCGECGICFAVPDYFKREKKKSGGDWFCPNGHCRVYRRTESDELKERLQQMTSNRDYYEKRAAENREEAEAQKRKVSAQKAAKTKLRRRIANGVCPCCTRTFQNLERHMQNKHPDYKPNCDGSGKKVVS